MADEPGAPVPMFTPEIQAMTPAEAGAALAKMQAELHPPPSSTPADAQEAQQLLNKLTADASWSRALVNGHEGARKQFDDLTRQVAAGDAVADAIAGVDPGVGSPLIETTSKGQLNRRDTAIAVNDFRAAGLDDASIAQAMNGAVVSAAEFRAAEALKAARMSNPAWVKAVLEGDFAATREFKLLSIVLSSTVEP